ncbi:unnamed protein product [Cylicocyclus nassatus]|uniref:Uncharacterized protein n=1 Tax=Cylicocyclus nassatus TaxID=53992 RepID=A0AA36DNV4_CYLNA|nr:unnamed protein product [Cylicocyclus nassatus]
MKSSPLLLAALLVGVHGKMQNITVKGFTVCREEVMPGVQVELWQRHLCFPDRLLDTMVTSKNGRFIVKGREDDSLHYQTFLKFTHTCNVAWVCRRVTELGIPESEIGTVYDLSAVVLTGMSEVDRLQCFEMTTSRHCREL